MIDGVDGIRFHAVSYHRGDPFSRRKNLGESYRVILWTIPVECLVRPVS